MRASISAMLQAVLPRRRASADIATAPAEPAAEAPAAAEPAAATPTATEPAELSGCNGVECGACKLPMPAPASKAAVAATSAAAGFIGALCPKWMAPLVALVWLVVHW